MYRKFCAAYNKYHLCAACLAPPPALDPRIAPNGYTFYLELCASCPWGAYACELARGF